jgi:hypothetical protein
MSAVAFLLLAKEMRPRLTVVIGIDPHKSSHTAAALDPDSHTVLDTVRVEATLVEHRRLLGWAKRFGSVDGRWRTATPPRLPLRTPPPCWQCWTNAA